MRNKRAKRFLCLPGERPEPEAAPATAKDADPQPEQPEQRATILMQITARAHKNKIITIQYFLMTADNKTSLDGPPSPLSPTQLPLSAIAPFRFRGALEKDNA